jgi:hypothetical protein
MIINTMLVGHVVTAEVEKTDANGTMHCIFLCHTSSGSEHLCLDFGQNWNASKGYKFTCNQMNVDRAAYWMKMYPSKAS